MFSKREVLEVSPRYDIAERTMAERLRSREFRLESERAHRLEPQFRACKRPLRETGNSASGEVIIAWRQFIASWLGQSAHPRGQQESFRNNAPTESALFRTECETRSVSGHVPNANRNPDPDFIRVDNRHDQQGGWEGEEDGRARAAGNSSFPAESFSLAPAETSR